MIAVVPAIIALIGHIMWYVCDNAKLQQTGHDMFLCGLLVLTFSLAGQTVKLF